MDVRWQQRLESFDRALALLAEPLGRTPSDLSMLEKEGTVQRFVYVWELSWKTIRDYLEAQGTSVQPVTPRSVLKEAFAAGILSDGPVWMAMVDHRNLLSHAYSQAAFEEAFEAIRTRYHGALKDLNTWLHAQEGVG